MTSIKIGLVGLGTAGRSLPQAIAKTPGFSFVAGADLRQTARAQYSAELGIKTFESIAALCELKELDAVYVATPNPYHAANSGSCIRCRARTDSSCAMGDADLDLAVATR